jgi:hypothetical protein
VEASRLEVCVYMTSTRNDFRSRRVCKIPNFIGATRRITDGRPSLTSCRAVAATGRELHLYSIVVKFLLVK